MQDGKYVILCVDDDPDLLFALRLVLQNNGYAVVEAASGEDALKVWRHAKPDLLIIDLMMEEVDAGTHLVTELKAAGCDKPILMLSSVGDALSLQADAAGLGLAGVFQKPIDNARLLKTIASKLKA